MTDALGERHARRSLAQVPLGRLGSPEDVAHAVAYLASPEAGVHHGRDAACQRRYVHDLIRIIAPIGPSFGLKH